MSLIVGAFRSARSETCFADADVGFKKLKTATSTVEEHDCAGVPVLCWHTENMEEGHNQGRRSPCVHASMDAKLFFLEIGKKN